MPMRLRRERVVMGPALNLRAHLVPSREEVTSSLVLAMTIPTVVDLSGWMRGSTMDTRVKFLRLHPWLAPANLAT